MRCLGRKYVKEYMLIMYNRYCEIIYKGPFDKEYLNKFKNDVNIDIIQSVTIIKDNFYHVIPMREK